MPDLFGKVAYSDLIDDIRGASPNEADIAGWDDHRLKMFILQAQERICQMAKVEDQWVLYLKTGFSQFNYTENPYITGASAASPIVMQTVSPHNLNQGDTIRQMRVAGVPGANGQFQVYQVISPTSYSIYNYEVITGATNASPIVINDTAHPFNTGDTVTIAGVLGNLAANGTWVITVVDQDHYSLNGSTGNGTYTGGGSATRITNGTGTTYVGPSGQYYRFNEIPDMFRDFKVGRMLVNNFLQEFRYVDPANLVDLQVRDNIFLLGQAATYIYPVRGMTTNRDTHRQFVVYPVPVVDIYLTGYGTIHINARTYANDNLGASIHLSAKWHEAIKKFVEYRVEDKLGHKKDAQVRYKEFLIEADIERKNRQIHPQMRITYE